jgi:hypothetical protein
VDFIAGNATCRRDRNATALIWAVAFWAAGTSTGSAAGCAVGPPTGSVLVVAASTHAGRIAVCWRCASDGWSLFRLTMFWRFAITDQCMASRCLYCTRAGISGYLTLTALPVPTPVFGKTSARIAQAHDNDVNYRQANELQESTRAMTMTDDRYRTLLGAFSAVADQPTVKAVLHSLRGVLASTSKLHGVELYC